MTCTRYASTLPSFGHTYVQGPSPCLLATRTVTAQHRSPLKVTYAEVGTVYHVGRQDQAPEYEQSIPQHKHDTAFMEGTRQPQNATHAAPTTGGRQDWSSRRCDWGLGHRGWARRGCWPCGSCGSQQCGVAAECQRHDHTVPMLTVHLQIAVVAVASGPHDHGDQERQTRHDAP